MDISDLQNKNLSQGNKKLSPVEKEIKKLGKQEKMGKYEKSSYKRQRERIL